jgi:hypothetical protein
LRLLNVNFLTLKSAISDKVLEKDLEEDDELEEESEYESELERDLRERLDLLCLAMLAMLEQKKDLMSIGTCEARVVLGSALFFFSVCALLPYLLLCLL